jgi:hypothetical protein
MLVIAKSNGDEAIQTPWWIASLGSQWRKRVGRPHMHAPMG